uniref:Uncharacterized protein n=1 Tax=Arundo donax TaxID=35708 RepID=A0A0A9F404_ARUDO
MPVDGVDGCWRVDAGISDPEGSPSDSAEGRPFCESSGLRVGSTRGFTQVRATRRCNTLCPVVCS